jgi:hypothetical protein
MSSLSGKQDPVVLRIAVADVGEAFSMGLRDFQALLLHDILPVLGHMTWHLYRRIVTIDTLEPA